MKNGYVIDKILVFFLNLAPVALVLFIIGCGGLSLFISIMNVNAIHMVMNIIICVLSTIGGGIVGVLLFLAYQKLLEYLFEINDRNE